MEKVFLDLYQLSESYTAPIETIITLFTIKYCESDIKIKFIKGKNKPQEKLYNIDISTFRHEILEDVPQDVANSCALPHIIVNEHSYIAGLCATLREIIKQSLTNDHCQGLLGFKDSCLLACSEVSVWTKFCEVDIISTLKFFDVNSNELPVTLARYECHMSQPVRLHNLYKYTMSKKFSKTCKTPEHIYAEGSTISLADIIIFVCIYIFLDNINITRVWNEKIIEILPLTFKWYTRMIQDERIFECLTIIEELKEIESDNSRNYILPVVQNQSLYKSDPKRYKPRNRIFTRQEDIDNSLEIIRNADVKTSLTGVIFAGDDNFDWLEIPFDATPEGGALPISRLKRKFEQLENLCKPVISIAKDGDIIVDFCSGSGHLGIIIAYLLPRCNVILLENKEESLNKAKERVKKLQLNNVKFFQCNLDYFKGNFNIGMSLHACGVATDLVIQHCIRRNAAFICCPCCYGSVHDCHHITYPRSEFFKNLIENRSYMVLGHAADQTHDVYNAKTKQGYECMEIIDTDRRLQAEQFGYKVHLGKLVPETCTPKNHLLVGIPSSIRL
ncbi:glutathione S-transferase C-terminal domain-containing protein homolog [Leptopilina heterotoma]|uniref:glutathione S-transferase C-terminal domain-containing protein homolog n=1 Tax=Leptopilina heterotoma TaxID=63436 RepID=UPI001CA87F61|nr:glutathione S-transferase C-terminal domain-containing protein homolog [Leptopilina heterotoma]